MSVEKHDAQPRRVLLWAIPRTLSTVFEKCIGSMSGVQIVNELYAFAYHFGPESIIAKDPDTEINKRMRAMLKAGQEAVGPDVKPGWFHDSICTFQWAKDTLEAPFPGKSLVFSKDIGFCITDKLHMLPRGFRHTFLIRHPHKVFPSWKGITLKGLQMEGLFRFQDIPEPYCPKRYGYAEMWDLVEYTKQQDDQNPVLIDADDLQASPASIMRQYCDAIGIPFNESMLQWPAGRDLLDEWIMNSTFVALNKIPNRGGFYEAAFSSTHFKAPSKIPSRNELTDDILELVDSSMPYYEKLYAMRIKP